MKLNTPIVTPKSYTHEGALAVRTNPLQQLRRSVLACMLWEDEFYESGQSVAARIAELVKECEPSDVWALAIKARQEMKLRHVPLLLVREMARLPEHKTLVASALENVIERPDEITEFLAIYWKDKRQPLSAQVKKGLAAAFEKFNEYSLAKYDREGRVRLRDALFLCHAKPTGAVKRWTKFERAEGGARRLSSREDLYKRLIEGKLETPDTWEVALSAGGGKRETFERLISEGKLGALALLRNLRNMEAAGVPKTFVAEALAKINTERVLPFRFIAAARALPAWEGIIEPAMLRCLEGREKLPGRTHLLIDVSGSMEHGLSGKSDLRRFDAACGLAILARELCDDVVVYTFSDRLVLVPPRRGFALRDAVLQSQPHGGTYLGRAVQGIKREPDDRLIVLTDEQSADRPPNPECTAYCINVASAKNGVGYGAWNHIDGWSEAVFDYIRELETVEGE